MKAFGGLEVQLRTFLTPALEEGGEVYALAAISGTGRCFPLIRTSITTNNNIFCHVTPCSLVKYRQKRFQFPSSTCEEGGEVPPKCHTF